MTQPKVYAAPPPPGPIEQSLVGQDRPTRLRLKAQALKDRLDALSYPVSYTMPYGAATIRIIVSDAAVVRVVKPGVDQFGLHIHLTARKVGGALLPTDPGGYRFWNVPVKVPNGTWRQITDPDTGKIRDKQNTEERPLDAVKQMVFETVISWSVSQGWVP